MRVWYIGGLLLASIAFATAYLYVSTPAGWLETRLKTPYGAVEPDGDSLCGELLDELKSRGRSGAKLSDLGQAEIEKQSKLWEICKRREEVEEINRKYRESQTLLGRIGTISGTISAISGLVLTFATALATLYIAYLGTKWTTTKTDAEQRHFEQRRSIERDEYDFKLFDALSNPTSPLGRMAASAALQARLKEIENDLARIREAKETGSKIDDNLETEGNLRNEQEMIVRVFLSALKISRVRIGEDEIASAFPSDTNAMPSVGAGPVATVAQEAASLTGIYHAPSAQHLYADDSKRNEALQIVANKAIAEAIAEATGCYVRHGDPATQRSPLISYDMQKLDLREVYWGSKAGSEWKNGRAGFNGRGLDFFEADLSDASFRDALLDGAIFYGATLERTQFRGASLRQANFSGARLVGCDFRSANLENCDLSGCELTNPKFDRETMLSGVKWPANFMPNIV